MKVTLAVIVLLRTIIYSTDSFHSLFFATTSLTREENIFIVSWLRRVKTWSGINQLRSQQSGADPSQIRQHSEDAKMLDSETDGLHCMN